MIQVIDEFNRPARADYGVLRVPPPEDEVEALFAAWRGWLPHSRKFLPAARDYLAASLWRRTGLRIRETYMLDIRDWRRDLGEYGKIHVRYGKGSRGRGPKTRLVPAINQAGDLLDWWLSDVRHQFGDDYASRMRRCCPASAVTRLPGCARGSGTRRCGTGWRTRSARSLPGWSGRLTPAHAAALLRLVDVCPRNGPEGDPGTARP